jgi:hypothetical protein
MKATLKYTNNQWYVKIELIAPRGKPVSYTLLPCQDAEHARAIMLAINRGQSPESS